MKPISENQVAGLLLGKRIHAIISAAFGGYQATVGAILCDNHFYFLAIGDLLTISQPVSGKQYQVVWNQYSQSRWRYAG